MKYIIALLFVAVGSNAFAETLHYTDYEGKKFKVEVSTGGILNWWSGDSVTLEEFSNVNVKVKKHDKHNLYESAELPHGIYSKTTESAALHSVVVALDKDAAAATRTDIQSMISEGRLHDKSLTAQKLCPAAAVGTILIAIRDFGYLNYCLTR